MVIFNTTFKAYNSFILLAVPFFLLTANLMNVGGITDRLVLVANDGGQLSRCAGADQRAAVVFFAGISGSSTADAASQARSSSRRRSRRVRPLVLDRHHRGIGRSGRDHPAVDPDDRLGRRAVGVDRALYLAGVIPGLLIGLAQMATVHVYAKVRHYPTYRRATLKEFFSAALGIGAWR
jgi:TRAP-type C4-dicarboxylate transport system permease large subunit